MVCAFSLQAVSLDELQAMTSSEKSSFFLQEEGKELDQSDDFFPALLIGLRDEDEGVREVAVSLVARIIPALQTMKSNQTEIPFNLALMPEVQSVLMGNLSSSNTRIKGGSITALVYSESPNSQIESELLNVLRNESEPKTQAHILNSLIDAGYDSENMKSALLESMNSESRHVVSSAAKGIELLTPNGGLEALEKHLNIDSLIRLGSVVKAIAAYGELAQVYLPKLNEILNNPSIGGSIVGDIERAIATIKNPNKLPARNASKALDLYTPLAVTLPQKPQGVISEISEMQTVKNEAKKPAEIKPIEVAEEMPEESSQWWLWLVGALIVVGGLLVVLRRKS
jgi:hypothetical protein